MVKVLNFFNDILKTSHLTNWKWQGLSHNLEAAIASTFLSQLQNQNMLESYTRNLEREKKEINKASAESDSSYETTYPQDLRMPNMPGTEDVRPWLRMIDNHTPMRHKFGKDTSLVKGIHHNKSSIKEPYE